MPIAGEQYVPDLFPPQHTRTLGAVPGGQVIGRMMGRHYDVPETATSFYRFPHIEKPKRYRDAYRESLDARELDAGEREQVINAARAAFAYNSGVFEGLRRTLDITPQD